MESQPDYEQDLASIRSIMERSSKFISLSGLSGILAGVYALIGSAIAYYLIYYPHSPFGFRSSYVNETEVVIRLLITAAGVLGASVLSGAALTIRQSQRKGVAVWSNTGKRMLLNLLIPLAAGGLFIITLLARGYFDIIAPSCLLFYGLALINCSYYTFGDVRYLGLCEILLGICCALLPGYGLIFWAAGFGLLHILYGSIMYFKYDR